MAAETNMESLAAARMDHAARDRLIQQETECVFVFSGRSGWPSGVVMSYIFTDGAFWLTSVLGRSQVTGARADPRVTIVISNHGADSRRDEGLVLPAVRPAAQPRRPGPVPGPAGQPEPGHPRMPASRRLDVARLAAASRRRPRRAAQA